MRRVGVLLVQGGELLREQQGHPFEDLGGDVVDPRHIR
jgi:hypothetical protein